MLATVFLLITLLALLLFYLGTGSDKRVLLYSLVWLLISGGLAWTGFFEDTAGMPPRFILVIAGIAAILFGYYRMLKYRPVDTGYLLLVHGLRLPVELCLYQLYLQQLIPVSMTYRGWNFDIITGITALILFACIRLKPGLISNRLLLIWNRAGILLLGIIVTTAILSAPLPIQLLAFDQPNIAVLQFPYIFLPAFIVPVVLLSHILMIRSIRRK